MSTPAHIWLTDEVGSPIPGPCIMPMRLGSIELKSVAHNIWLPSDNNTGKLTGTRMHQPMTFTKEFDNTTPVLYRAICEGRVLKSALIKMYRILDQGVEHEYFNIKMENVKLTSITPVLHQTGNTGTHFEEIELRYETIEWKHCDGNIIYKDTWNGRVVI
ncbi:Hcp family type VI secretion system effector [Enterobacter oligotrophicus]